MSAARVFALSLLSIGRTGTFAKLRIGDVAQHVGVGELLRFDHHVHRLRARQAVLAERVLLHHVEHHQRRDALRVRRQLVHRPSAVRRRDRIDPLGLILLQVRGGHRAALALATREDRSAVLPS